MLARTPRSAEAQVWRRLMPLVGLHLAVAILYLATTLWINGGTIFKPSFVDYYTRLMDGVAHGHLWIADDGGVYDLAKFQGRVYLYWGPSPLLLIAPFYFLGHGFQHDVAYTFVLGLGNVVVFSWMIHEAAGALRIPLRPSVLVLVTLLFALASPNFYLSVQGRIWHTSQIAATFYCLLSLAFTFRFINRLHVVDAVLGTICFCLAWDARMTFLAIGPLLAYGAFHAWQRDRALGVKSLAVLAAVGLTAVGGWLFYNYVRFGRVTETGYTYMHHAERFLDVARNGPLWSWTYLRHNWHHYIQEGPIDFKEWRLSFNVEGNSILWMYPWTVLTLAFPLVWRRMASESRPLLAVVAGIALVQFVAELTFYSTGWTQVGARYFLDSVPILFVMLLPVFIRTPRLVLAAGVALGLALNLVGMAHFYGVPLG